MSEASDPQTFDQAHFGVMTGDDRALQVEVVGIFRAQIETMRPEFAPQTPVATWKATAHKLKGSARGIGLWALAEACVRAEAAAADPIHAGPALADVNAAIDIALAALSEQGFPARAA